MFKLISLLTRFDFQIVLLGIILTILGLSLNIAASINNKDAFDIEQDLKKNNNNDKILIEQIFEKRIYASKLGYIGVILMALGFIFINLLHTYVMYINHKI